MKIAWSINLYPPYIMGGNEMIANDVITELRHRGHEVYLLTGQGEKLPKDQYHLAPFNLDLDAMEERFMGTRAPSIIESIQWHVFDSYTYQATVQTLQTIKPDLVIIDNFALISPAPLLAAIHTGFNTVIRVLDQWLIHGLKMPEKGLWHCPKRQQRVILPLKRLTQPVFNRWARHIPIITNSHFIKQSHINAGFKAEQLSMVHLGIDVETFSANTDRLQFHTPIRLMFAGTLWGGKGPQTAVQALAELRKQAPQCPFVLHIYGKGTVDFQDYLHKLANHLGVSELVYYHGFVSQSELAQAFQENDIFLFTSIWEEPFSITLLQALASGIPVISTTTGGSPEAVDEGQTGLLVPPDDPVALTGAILKLVETPGLRCQLSHQAAKAVRERWSFKHYVDSLDQLHQLYAKKNPQ